MPASQPLLPDAYVAKIAQRIAQLADPAAPRPSEDQLADCVRAVFLASLLHEEGSHVSIAVGFVAPEAAGEGSAPFRTPVLLSPSALVKLSAAIDPDSTQVGVFSRGDALHAWGFIRGVSHQHLVLRATRPGALRVEYLGRLILSYVDGTVVTEPQNAEFERALREHWPTPLTDAIITDCVRELVYSVLRARRGGTVLFVRSDAHEIGSGFESWNRFARPVFTLHDLENPTERRRAIAFLSSLTQADGAVVMDDRLNALGFGAMIRSLSAARSGGARHRSAQGFVESFGAGEVLAVICSHDGEISVVWKEANGSGAWRGSATGILPIEW
jgi:hypothetical protein